MTIASATATCLNLGHQWARRFISLLPPPESARSCSGERSTLPHGEDPATTTTAPRLLPWHQHHRHRGTGSVRRHHSPICERAAVEQALRRTAVADPSFPAATRRCWFSVSMTKGKPEHLFLRSQEALALRRHGYCNDIYCSFDLSRSPRFAMAHGSNGSGRNRVFCLKPHA